MNTEDHQQHTEGALAPCPGYAAPSELPQASETGTGAGGGVGGVRDEWSDAKNQWTFAKDIVGAFAMWACRQSPYGVPDNLEPVCKRLHEGLKTAVAWDANGMAELSLKQIEDAMRGILYEKGVREFDAWNERRNGREGMGFCSRYDSPEADDDFIDLDALLRNVCITIRDERRKDRAFDERFEREEVGRAAGAGELAGDSAATQHSGAGSPSAGDELLAGSGARQQD